MYQHTGLSHRTFVLAGILLTLTLAATAPSIAALLDGGKGNDVLIGRDDDNLNNPLIQPDGVAANQSLNNTDVITGGPGNDVLIGLRGSDVLDGGPGHDILVGGPEGGTQPNSDIMFGGPGDDVSLWAPGDGSDAFIGGPGIDALVFGVIDRDGNSVPTLTGAFPGFPAGVPTANVSGQGGFCRIDRVEDPSLGYDFLIRFFARATGNLAVTVRVKEVEQVFCTSEAGGAITFADLTQGQPAFIEVSTAEAAAVNPLVGAIIR